MASVVRRTTLCNDNLRGHSTELRLAEVAQLRSTGVRGFAPPGVPGGNALPYSSEILVVCHIGAPAACGHDSSIVRSGVPYGLNEGGSARPGAVVARNRRRQR